jgi:hypothetical protein
MPTPATPQLIGTGIANVTWGISGVAYTGICTSISVKRDGEQTVIYDGNGFTIGQILFDDHDEATIEMVLQTTDTIPTRGALVTIAGQTGHIIQNIEKMYSWKDMAKWRFTSKRFVNLATS